MSGITINSVMTAISAFLFCGFISAFIIPDLVLMIGYMIPNTIHFSRQGKMQYRAVGVFIRKICIWAIFLIVLYGAAYLIDRDVFWYLLCSKVAIFCWFLSIARLVQTFIFYRSVFMDNFYQGVYLEYATPEEGQRYQEFITRVEGMSVKEAEAESERPDLSYLEKRALRERINLLQESNM